MPSAVKILLVEDDRAIQFGTMKRLSACGYEVLTADNGAEALAQADAHLPNLILLDIRMSVMDGLTALRALKDNPATANIPVIIVSASPGDQGSALDFGAEYFLRKPFSADLLQSTVEHFVATNCNAAN